MASSSTVTRRAMTDDSFAVRKGPFKGKRVELASTTGVRTFEEIAEDVMLTP